MELVNKAHAQLKDVYRSLTPGTRAMAAMLVIVVLVSLVFVTRVQRGGADVELMGSRCFPVSQLTTMEMAFAKAGLCDYELVDNRIRVPHGRQAAYMAALAEADAIPPDFGKYLEKVAASANPFYSRLQMEAMIKAATQNELQAVIRRMRNGTVELASVLYEVQEKRGLMPEKVVTASVSVKLAGSQCIDREMVQSLRHLVCSGIGCKPENVTVIDLNGGGPYPGGCDDRAVTSNADDPDAARKQKYENWYRDKVREHLGYIHGVVVSANVEFAPAPQRPFECEGASAVYHRGAPGGQELVELAATTSSLPRQQLPRVAIAVGVPRTYYEDIWRQRNALLTGRTSERPSSGDLLAIETRVHEDVEKAVVALLPPSGGATNSSPRVQITTIEPVGPPVVLKPETKDQMLAWFEQHWSILATLGLTALGIGMVGSMIRPAPGQVIDAGTVASAPVTEKRPSIEPQPEIAPPGTWSRDVVASTLNDELADVVREDPDVAVSVLRTWIGNAS